MNADDFEFRARARCVWQIWGRLSYISRSLVLLSGGSFSRSLLAARETLAGYIVSWLSEARRLVGYWIGKRWWGRGVATGGLATFVERVPVRPLYARVVKDNIGSIRVLEKCRFALCTELTQTLPAASDGVEELIFVLGGVACESGPIRFSECDVWSVTRLKRILECYVPVQLQSQ